MKNLKSAPAACENPPQRPENERLPLGKTCAYGFQHVLTMYGSIIAVPLIVATAAGLNQTETVSLVTACLFIGGLATVLQSAGLPFFGAKLPLVQGVSFAVVAPILAILAGGGDLATVFGATIVASVLGIFLAKYFAKIIRFFPPVVTGTVITAIGLILVPVSVNWVMGGDPATDNYGSLTNIGLGFLTLAIVLTLSKLGVASLSRLSILLGLVIGTVAAFFMGQTDFSEVGQGAIFSLPEFFAFGLPKFEIAAIISMLIVVLVTMTETTADIMAVGEIVGTPVDSKRIADGLRADMLSSSIAPVFGSFTQTAFAANVGLVAITGVRSRWVVTAAGAILMLLGLLPVVGQIVAAVPLPVLGGAGLVLFGTVAASGIRNLQKVNFTNSMNLIIVAVSLTFGMIPVVSPEFWAGFPDWYRTIFESGISSAAIMAILLNLLFNELLVGNSENPSTFAAKPIRYLTPTNLKSLEEGDVFIDGKFVDCDGEEIPLVPEEHAPVVQAHIDSGEVTDTAQIYQVLQKVKESEDSR
ncbi:nucleobase:cation symporter-2 family protein [Micrococcoides hystricis]|uniref:Nucleobase:cation symporter-2 family protein n=1 Tax=Micrococcoides hystricis TaxID=1572761 RepID=A0ABV6PAY0_9MICC